MKSYILILSIVLISNSVLSQKSIHIADHKSTSNNIYFDPKSNTDSKEIYFTKDKSQSDLSVYINQDLIYCRNSDFNLARHASSADKVFISPVSIYSGRRIHISSTKSSNSKKIFITEYQSEADLVLCFSEDDLIDQFEGKPKARAIQELVSIVSYDKLFRISKEKVKGFKSNIDSCLSELESCEYNAEELKYKLSSLYEDFDRLKSLHKEALFLIDNTNSYLSSFTTYLSYVHSIATPLGCEEVEDALNNTESSAASIKYILEQIKFKLLDMENEESEDELRSGLTEIHALSQRFYDDFNEAKYSLRRANNVFESCD